MVVLPAALVDELAQEAHEMTVFEDFVHEQVREGKSIIGLYPCTLEENRVAFEAWQKDKNK